MPMITFKCNIALSSKDIPMRLREYGIDTVGWADMERYIPSYNIAAGNNAAVVLRGVENNHKHLTLRTMRWGLLPHWCRTDNRSIPTARSAAIVGTDNILWSSLRESKRCMIPCQGFYARLKKGKDEIPHYFRRADGKLVLLAGFYDIAFVNGQRVFSFAIATAETKSRTLMRPLILSTPAAANTWLDTSPPRWDLEVARLVEHSALDNEFVFHAVQARIERSGSNSPSLIRPLAERKDGIAAAFTRQVGKAPRANAVGPSSVVLQSPVRASLKRKRDRSGNEDEQGCEESPLVSLANRRKRLKRESASASPSKLPRSGKDSLDV